MSDNRTPQEILLKLDELLHNTTHETRGDRTINGPEYAILHEEFHKVTNKEHESNIKIVLEQACETIESKSLSTFRLCSIGCGDGRFDKAVLEGITATTLEHIDYLGIDANPLSCEKNRQLLSDLKNVSVTILNEDVQIMDIKGHDDYSKIQEFDLVIIVHAFYYMQSPEKCLDVARNLTKQNGTMLIMNRDKQPLNGLFDPFALHREGTKQTLMSSVVAALDSMKLTYTRKQYESLLDFTQLVKDNFALVYQRHVLDFIVHAQLGQYSSQVTEECIAYLISIADGKPDHYYIKAFTDVVTVNL